MVTLVTVILPGARGVRAKKKLLELAAKIKARYGIHFNREAHDEYEALYGIILALDQLLREQTIGEKEAESIKQVFDEIIEDKGEITSEGVYVWPRHAKETAEQAGIDWEEFKENMKKAGLIEYDKKKRKYRVNTK